MPTAAASARSRHLFSGTVPHQQRTAIPPFLHGLIDDAAVFPPGNAALADALPRHEEYRNSWYAPLVGPLLLPASLLPELPTIDKPLRIGIIADTGIEAVAAAIAALPDNVTAVQVEARAPELNTLINLLATAQDWQLPVFAEIPVSRNLPQSLERLGPTAVVPKFRLGGLTADLFPSPVDLATAMVGCAEHGLGYKPTAGLHRAVRHTDPRTHFTHHGFCNIAAATLAADAGESVASVTETLQITESGPLVDRIRGMLAHPRPLWAGFGSCSIAEPLEDLIGLSLVHEES